MSQFKNKYGLQRDIPPAVMRQVRRRCGYGCIFCGSFIVQYDHFDPTFVESKSHSPDGIVLLCPNHHQTKTPGQIGVRMIRERLAEIAGKEHVSYWHFPIDMTPSISIGKCRLNGVRSILQIDGENILSIDPPEVEGAPPRVNARFFDSTKKLVAEIKDNTWLCYSRVWDAESVGNRYIVREKHGQLSIELELLEGHLSIARLQLQYGKARVEVERNGAIKVQTFGKKAALLKIPSVPTVTTDSLRWIDIDNSVIRWSADNIHNLLDDLPSENLPLPEARGLKFGKIASTLVLPKFSDSPDPFCTLTINQLAVCPVDVAPPPDASMLEHGDFLRHGRTYFRTEQVMQGEHAYVSAYVPGNEPWRKPWNSIDRSPNSSETFESVVRKIDETLGLMKHEGARASQWAEIMFQKYRWLAICEKQNDAEEVLAEIGMRVPVMYDYYQKKIKNG